MFGLAKRDEECFRYNDGSISCYDSFWSTDVSFPPVMGEMVG